MRGLLWGIAAAALAIGAWTVVPSAVVQRQLDLALRERLQPAGRLEVRARATALGLLRGQVARATVAAAGVRTGEITAERLTAEFRGLRFARTQQDVLDVTGVDSGAVELHVTRADLEAYLTRRGVENPSVAIDEAGVTVSGTLRAGPVAAPVRLTGQFVVAGETDLLFSVASVDVGGLNVPGQLVTALLGASEHPIISLRRLPVRVVIDRVASSAGRVVLTAHVERTP
jgi:hypothetical protein